MLKFALKKDHLSTNKCFSWTTEKEMTPDNLDIEPGAAVNLLANLVNTGSGATADDDKAEVGQSPPSIPTQLQILFLLLYYQTSQLQWLFVIFANHNLS